MSLMFINIGETVKEGFMGICIALDAIIYGLVGSAYKIFMALAGARILNSDMFNEIANKIYIIIGVVMLFVLAYALLRGIINPDGKSNNMSAPTILKSVVIAVLGLALTPVIFNLLYQAQGVFVEKDVLARIFFRDTEEVFQGGSYSTATYDLDGNQTGTTNVELKDIKYNQSIKNIGGAYTATELWKAFFKPAAGGSPETIVAVDGELLIKGGGLWAMGAAAVAAAICVAIPGVGWLVGAAITAGTLVGSGLIIAGINEANQAAVDKDHITLQYAYTLSSSGADGGFTIYSAFIKNYIGIDAKGKELPMDQQINYVWFVSAIAGIFTVYAFISFGIDMGVRAVKLAYYQIIAPIPLILQVIPSFKSNFSKYIKSVFSTFAEIFVRISAVYIIVYLIAHLGESSLFSPSMVETFDLKAEKPIAVAILILGLITFARQAPKIIADTFGIQSGSMSFGITKKLADGGGLMAGAAIGAGVSGLVRNGAHAIGNVRNAKDTKDKWKAAGRGIASTIAGGASGFVRGGYGARNAKNFSEMSKSASDAANKVTDIRDKREQYAQEHGKGDFGSVARARVKDVGSKIQDWAIGTVDTSYYDNRVKLDESMANLKSDLENSTAKDTYVVNHQQHIDELKRMNTADYAYNKAVDKRVAMALSEKAVENVRERLLARRAGETDEAYARRFETWTQASVANQQAFAAAYAAEYDDLEINSKEEILDKIHNDSSYKWYFNKDNFVVDPTSQEYKDAEAELAKARNDAELEMKGIKSDAVQRALAQAAATGVDNDTSRIYKKFFEDNQADLRKYSNVEFGNTHDTLAEYIKTNFGDGALNGNVDMNLTLHDTDYKFDVDVTSPTGAVTKETITYDHTTGEYYNSAGTSLGTDILKDTGTYKVNQVTSGSLNVTTTPTGTTTTFTDGRYKSNTSAFKDVAQADQTNVTSDSAYRAAKRRKRQQQSK